MDGDLLLAGDITAAEAGGERMDWRKWLYKITYMAGEGLHRGVGGRRLPSAQFRIIHPVAGGGVCSTKQPKGSQQLIWLHPSGTVSL